MCTDFLCGQKFLGLPLIYRFHELNKDKEYSAETLRALFKREIVAGLKLLTPVLLAYFEWLMWAITTIGAVDWVHKN